MDLEVAKAALMAEQERINHDLVVARLGLAGSTHDSASRLGAGSDDAVATLEAEVSTGVIDDLETSRHEVDAALARIIEGTFGVCVACGVAVPDARLKTLPACARCIECQRMQERG